jgi:hypothetical protein
MGEAIVYYDNNFQRTVFHGMLKIHECDVNVSVYYIFHTKPTFSIQNYLFKLRIKRIAKNLAPQHNKD